jgi:LCP family protein required for cell wall assembly
VDYPTSNADPKGGQSPAEQPMSRRGARRARTRHRWLRALLITAIVIVATLIVLGAGAYIYARYRFDQIKKVNAQHLVPQAAPGKPFNILLVGSDTRKFVDTTKQATEFGTPSIQGGQRSDVTIVARFIPATRQVWVLSIPRDLWVHIPGHKSGVSGPNRINAAFDNGPSLLIETIEKDLGIPINHYMSVTFQGFQNMVNALGGLTMNFPDPVKDSYSGLDVTQTGCQVVNGATSLELVRARHLYYEATGEWQYDGLSDFSRIQRQDAFFRALLDKLNSVKFNPFTINSFIGAAVHDLTIDNTLSEGDLISMANEFHGLSQGNLHTETLPTYGFTTTGGAAVLGEAQPQATQTIATFNHVGGTTAPSSTTGSTSTSTTAPTLSPAQVAVQVLNGSDPSAPLASQTAAALEHQGFSVRGIANAPTTVPTTEIEYAEGHADAGATVAARIEGKTVQAADPQLHGAQVTLVVGKTFSGVKVVAPPSTRSSTGSTTTPTSTTTTTPASANSTGYGTTTTTTPPSIVQANTKQEPWNPTPCTM